MKSSSNVTVVIVAIVLSAATALGITTFATANVVQLKDRGALEAQAFRLVDANGKMRAILDVNEHGPSLGLYDAKGKLRVWLTATEEQQGMALYNARGKQRTALDSTEKEARLIFYDANGEPHGTALVTTEEGQSLIFLDAKGKPRVFLMLNENGPVLQLQDANGNKRAVLSTTEEGAGINLGDANGKVRVRLDAMKKQGRLTLQDATGEPRASLLVTEEGPNLAFHDAKGKLRVWLRGRNDGPELTFLDAMENTRAFLSVQDETGQNLKLYDAKGVSQVIGLFNTVVLDVTTKGYQRLETSVGPFLISVEDAEKYLDGYKLRLKLANLTSATFEDLEMNVSWGKESTGKGHNKKFSSFAELKPGVWTPVEVLLSPAEMEDLKQVRVGNLRINTVKTPRVQGGE